MTTHKEALKLALDALENHSGNYKLTKDECVKYRAVEDAIKEALAQPEQEPVAHSVVKPLRPDEYQRRVSVKWVGQPVAGPLYNTPPQRTWVGLTIEEMHQLNDALNLNGRFPIIAAIEAKLKEKNT